MNIIDYNSIQREIERERCFKHGQNPKFTKTHDGFSIDACCEEFRRKLVAKSEKLIAQEAEKGISKMMKNMFKS